MGSEPLRILHYIKHLESGGGETMLYNIYKNIDRERIQFDFLVNDQKEEKLDQKIKELGGRKVVLMNKEPLITPYKILLVVIGLQKLLAGGEYSIIHIHCSNGQGLLYSLIAKIAGVPVRIVHIHNTTVEGLFSSLKLVFHKFCKNFYMNAPTDYFACSNMAAQWLYSEKVIKSSSFHILKNGIEVSKFAFNATERNNIRYELGWEGKKVLINIGRMEIEKNHGFLLKIMSKLIKKDSDYRLLVIGRGSLADNFTKLSKSLELDGYVKVIEYTDAVERYLWGSDLFLLPSFSEGLGIVAIESQAAGLPIFVSDTLPEDIFITDIINKFSIDNIQKWVEAILEYDFPTINRKSYNRQIQCAGYDIKEVAKQLQEFYLSKEC